MSENNADLSSISDKELRQELQCRETQRKEVERQQRKKMTELVIEHREVLKKFMTHGRSSCEGGLSHRNQRYHPNHGGAECNLCCLEDLYKGEDDIEIMVSITLHKIVD